jgi:hypothetical protein
MRISRRDMLKIMQETDALDDLDISEDDFLDGHGREDLYVAVMERAWELGYAAANARTHLASEL